MHVSTTATRRQNKKHDDEMMMMSFADDCNVSIDIELWLQKQQQPAFNVRIS